MLYIVCACYLGTAVILILIRKGYRMQRTAANRVDKQLFSSFFEGFLVSDYANIMRK